MILLLALLQSAAVGPPADAASAQPRYERCIDLATQNPALGVEEAGAWNIAGGGFLARQCLGIAYANQQKWPAAATEFERAARDAEVAKDGRAAGFWAQAGNAFLAGGDAQKARTALNAAIAHGSLTGLDLGEVHLDRARAFVASGDLAAARTDLDKATKLAAADPLVWLLSATLARRAGDLPRAQGDIATALKLSADDAQVRLEAGNIAALKGDEAEAKAQWNAAIVNAPESDAATAARSALAQFAAP